MLAKLNRIAEARELYERLLEIQRRQLGDAHPSLAFTYHGLGKVLVKQGELKAALPVFEAGLRIREASLGPESVLTADLLSSLANLRMRMGDVDLARKLLERTFALHYPAYGPDHSQTLESRRSLAFGLIRAQRYDDAISHLRDLLRRNLPPGLRIDLADAAFDSMRSHPAFRVLTAEEAQRAADGSSQVK
jgi:tetratricopeptide (TPR) repeat protein